MGSDGDDAFYRQWLAEFERTGEVVVRQSRAKVGGGLVAGGIAFTAMGLFLLLLPAPQLAPVPVTRVAGGLGLVLGLVSLGCGIATLVRPALVAKLGRDGLEPPVGPAVRWDEVLDATVVDVATTQLPAIHVTSSYAERARGQVRDRRRWSWERGLAMLGHQGVFLRHAPPGGNEQLVRLVLTVRDRMR